MLLDHKVLLCDLSTLPLEASAEFCPEVEANVILGEPEILDILRRWEKPCGSCRQLEHELKVTGKKLEMTEKALKMRVKPVRRRERRPQQPAGP